MRRIVGLVAGLAVAWPVASWAACGSGCAVEQITSANAASRLFGGTDSAGGIDDWYLTNGTVEAIVDDIGTVDIDVVAGTQSVPKTSSNAVETGGTLVDIGLRKKNNDQVPQSFNVGGLSLDNVFLFHQGDESAWGATTNPCTDIDGVNTECPAEPDCAAITVFGIVLYPGKSTRTAPTLRVRTRYEACAGERQLRLRSEIWNQSTDGTLKLPTFDVFLWGGRGLVPFLAAEERGFLHPVLDLPNAASLLTAGAYFAAPGNNNVKDGIVARGKKPGAVSYGYVTGVDSNFSAQIDADGPASGSAPANVGGSGFNDLMTIQSGLLSAGFAPAFLSVATPIGASSIYNRRIVVGDKNDVNSVVGDPKNPQNILGSLSNWVLGTVSGAIKPGSKEEGTITFVRTGPSPLTNPALALNSPVTSVRTKAGYSKVQLPDGEYKAIAVVPGRADKIVTGITVTAGSNTRVDFAYDASTEKTGTLKALITDSATSAGMPAKLSLSPSPSFHREFAAFDYDLRAGMCSNDLSNPTGCTLDGECGVGTCFRVCANKEPAKCETTGDCTGSEVCASDDRCRSHACSSDTDCDPGVKCAADTESVVPESFPGGNAHLNVIYTDNGKVKANVKPGTYTVHISRGPEYSIKQQASVTVPAGGTIDLGTISLTRVVNTSGYVSADFHIHSARSLDSSVPLQSRVRSFAAEGLEVMVSTDHDINTDYAPIIKKMKLDSFLNSIPGTEVTTSVGTPPFFSNAWGHINAWPQKYAVDERRNGSVEDENVSASVIYDRLRGSGKKCVGGTVPGNACASDSECGTGGKCTSVAVQLNHPRAGVSGVTNIGMFDNIGFDPSAPVTDCQEYPVICPTSKCFLGTNDGTSCTSSATCTGGGVCGCISGSVPAMADGCNEILLDLNVVPRAGLCTSPGCGGGFEGTNGTRNIDFDVMEIDNGGGTSSWPAVKQVRRDWISLLNQGVEVGASGNRHPLWGTGVSDSHRMVGELPGYSRTYVAAGDLPIDAKVFNDEVLGGNMVATAGPFIEFDVDNGGTPAEIGDTLSVPGGGAVDLNITVKAAPWIPVEEVRIIKNGCVLACFNSTTSDPVLNDPPADRYDQTSTGVLRFSATISDPSVTGDSYYIVEASPDLPASGKPDVDAVVDAVAAGAFPYGFTNPIFVDTDGGGYDGIGTPEPSCGALPVSCSAGAAVATGPSMTMYARAPSVRAKEGFFARMMSRLAGDETANACDTGERPESEVERLEEHEKAIRRSSRDYFPWHMIKIPDPTKEASKSTP